MENEKLKFEYRNTIRYSLFGVVFGLVFPIIATILESSILFDRFSFNNLQVAFNATPLLWIIDTAPIFLGAFAAFAGYQMDKLAVKNKELNRRSKLRAQLAREKELLRITAEHANLEKDVFLANMSHEIRTPLNAIIGFTELLKESELDNAQNKHVQIISSALKNLNVIINDILDLSKLESGKFEFEKSSFNLQKLLRRIINMHVESARLKNNIIDFYFNSKTPEIVIGDETRLFQILNNLLSNAIKFTENGQIKLELDTKVEKNVANIQFKVKDTGIGIDPSKLNLIFDRFSQAENNTTRLFGGTGLGLSIVKLLVELQGGRLYAESELGKGSDFIFHLSFPISQETVVVDDNEAQDLLIDSLKSLDNLKILLVEDNEHNQILAKTYLERNGAIVQIASNGSLGVKAVENNNYDVIIMDIQMPKMDGISATKVIRKKLKIQIPIIGCSAHALESEKKKCINAGMNDYITKPYNEYDLINTCAKYALSSNSVHDYIDFKDNSTPSEDDLHEILSDIEKKLGRDTVQVLKNMMSSRIPSDIDKIELFFNQKNFKSLAALSHNLRGSLLSLEMKEGAKYTLELENAIRNNEYDQIGLAVKSLLEYLQNLKEFKK